MTAKNDRTPFLKKMRALLDRFRVQALATIAIITAIVLLLAQIFPQINEIILNSSVIPYLTLLVVLDIAYALDAHRVDPTTQVMTNQDESLDDLISIVQNCSQVDLLEYAGSTTLPLIRRIERHKIPMRLLIKHPDSVDGFQRQRTVTTLDTLYNSVFTNQSAKFEIRCYRLPYSLRGRHLHGRTIELGWLTPDIDRKTAYGHQNPSTLVDVAGSQNVHLKEFFERTFNDYWDHADTEDGRKVLERFQAISESNAQNP